MLALAALLAGCALQPARPPSPMPEPGANSRYQYRQGDRLTYAVEGAGTLQLRHPAGGLLDITAQALSGRYRFAFTGEVRVDAVHDGVASVTYLVHDLQADLKVLGHSQRIEQDLLTVTAEITAAGGEVLAVSAPAPGLPQSSLSELVEGAVILSVVRHTLLLLPPDRSPGEQWPARLPLGATGADGPVLTGQTQLRDADAAAGLVSVDHHLSGALDLQTAGGPELDLQMQGRHLYDGDTALLTDAVWHWQGSGALDVPALGSRLPTTLQNRLHIKPIGGPRHTG